MNGVKDLLTYAVVIGGAYPHRLGLSETVLVFEHHCKFMGGFEALVDKIPEIKARCIEKKLLVEADAEHALALAGTDVDGIQLDKGPRRRARRARGVDPRRQPARHAHRDGRHQSGNASAYAATGVDGMASTAPFSVKPLDHERQDQGLVIDAVGCARGGLHSAGPGGIGSLPVFAAFGGCEAGGCGASAGMPFGMRVRGRFEGAGASFRLFGAGAA